MREIKFRAWERILKVMLPVNEIYFYEGKVWMVKLPTQINRTDTSYIELMQFTGLLDKNGKEIYEGDIIKIEHPHKSRTFDGPVEWLDYGWGCKDFHFSHFDSPVDIFSEGTEYIEVIGNIYQNKDLLR